MIFISSSLRFATHLRKVNSLSMEPTYGDVPLRNPPTQISKIFLPSRFQFLFPSFTSQSQSCETQPQSSPPKTASSLWTRRALRPTIAPALSRIL